jgi:NADPH:quinone reductase-like Zn-dependent oxidoreductase
MWAWQIANNFGLENLFLTETAAPKEPSPHDIIVRPRAWSINYRDLKVIKGLYNPKQPLPLVPLSDGAGDVVAAGASVKRFKVGDKVIGTFSQGWLCGPPPTDLTRATLGGPLPGMLSELVVLNEEGTVHMPESLSYVEAATLPCAALTAWRAIVDEGRAKPGQDVLILGSGGVALFALAFAKMCGARTLIASRSANKLKRLKALGADVCIDTSNTPVFAPEVKAHTRGAGADMVVELGGIGTLEQSIHSTKAGGSVVLIGSVTGGKGSFDLQSVFMRSIKLLGVLVGNRSQFEAMNAAISLHQLKPFIDQTFSLKTAPMAIAAIEGNDHMGKICIDIERK